VGLAGGDVRVVDGAVRGAVRGRGMRGRVAVRVHGVEFLVGGERHRVSVDRGELMRVERHGCGSNKYGL